MIMYKWLVILLFFFCEQAMAQEQEPFDQHNGKNRPVSVDSIVPDFRLYSVLNYKKAEVNLSEFKGKAILIDFWAAFCQPCLAQFPKLQSIQEKYRQHLQIITITYDSTQKITALFEKIRYQGFNLLTATRGANSNANDSLFFAFPHKYIPHYIWIDKDRILKAVTGYEAVNEDNIALLVSGGPLPFMGQPDSNALELHRAALYSYQESDITERLMLNDSIKGLIGYSMLSAYNKKYPPSSAIDNNGIYDERRIRTWNLPLSTMMRMAFGSLSKDPREQVLVPVPRVFFNIRDSGTLRKLTVNFTAPPDTTSDMYCYDLITTGKGMRLLQERMKEDLYRYFGVRGVKAKKRVWCYVLSLKDSSLLKTKGGETQCEGNMYYLKLNNASFSSLVEHIRSYNEGGKTTPYRGLESAIIEDDTRLSAKIDIHLKARMNDIPALKLALGTYGIELREEERLVDVLFLED
jgi:thiol-disulfide isomerase/thioredoxin